MTPPTASRRSPSPIEAARRGAALVLLAIAPLSAGAADAWPARLAAAARAGDGAAAVLSARAVLWGTQQGERRQALAVLEEHARRGDAHAAAALASAHFRGAAGSADPARARDWWRVAASGGETDAAYNLALSLLASGTDRAAALAALGTAAGARHALACFALGTLQAAEDADAARASLACAAEQAYAPAQFNLAVLAERAGDLAAARQWYAAAAPAFRPAAAALAALPPSTALPPPATPSAPLARSTAPAAVLPNAAGTVHDLAWVLAQPAANFTLQVAAGAAPAGLIRLLRAAAGADVAAVFLHRPGAREPYSAVLGSFPDGNAARARLATLPAALQRNAPLMRRYSSLQRELAAHADAAR